MTGHRIEKCVHGTVVRQCRCLGPKMTVTVPCPATCTGAPLPEGVRVAEPR